MRRTGHLVFTISPRRNNGNRNNGARETQTRPRRVATVIVLHPDELLVTSNHLVGDVPRKLRRSAHLHSIAALANLAGSRAIDDNGQPGGVYREGAPHFPRT